MFGVEFSTFLLEIVLITGSLGLVVILGKNVHFILFNYLLILSFNVLNPIQTIPS